MKEITIEECLLPINAALYGTSFDPPHQMVHACECGTPGEICVSEELYEAMRQHFAANRSALDVPKNNRASGSRPAASTEDGMVGTLNVDASKDWRITMTNENRLMQVEPGVVKELRTAPGPVAGSYTVTFRSSAIGSDITRTGTSVDDACGIILDVLRSNAEGQPRRDAT